MPTSNTDRNLLFGILALQMDFITKDALIQAINAGFWTKGRRVGKSYWSRRLYFPTLMPYSRPWLPSIWKCTRTTRR
jgi:hypothetical protein